MESFGSWGWRPCGTPFEIPKYMTCKSLSSFFLAALSVYALGMSQPIWAANEPGELGKVLPNEGSLENKCALNLRTNIQLLSGGIQFNGALVVEEGSYGGARWAKIIEDGEELDVIETMITFNNSFGFVGNTSESIEEATQLHILAGELGWGPKVYGYKDAEVNGETTRLIYSAPIGSTPGTIPMLNPDTKKIQKIHMIGNFMDGFNDHIPGPKWFNRGELKPDGWRGDDLPKEKFLKLEEEISKFKLIHPDFSERNILIEFFYDSNGQLDIRLYGVDWNNPNQDLGFHQDRLEKLKKLGRRWEE